tara:strand:+ start:1734 stop:2969 length:1236 start_codon:yes stop_codon:yes gene_type:complete
MYRKLFIYIGLIIFAINIGNSNISNLFSFIKQKVLIHTITKETTNICKPLQQKIEDYIYDFRNNISISILTENGKFIVDINGDLARIPASNQKILSSAFALDNLGPHYTLNTSLIKLYDGSLFIDASGDPDFDRYHLNFLISGLNKSTNSSEGKIPIFIVNKNSVNWWPSSWSAIDRKKEYGAPITKYSIASNANAHALINPINNFVNELESVIRLNKLSDKYFVEILNHGRSIDFISTIKTVHSAPLYVLLNLINSQSHNFTSEVVFRHALNNWSHAFPNEKYQKWLTNQNFNSARFVFADASGLSRDNRVTTSGLSQFLRRMTLNRYSDYYYSSFSILGVRGSLSKVQSPLSLKGRVIAKSGTLNNVKSVSGIILGQRKYFSIIVNNMEDSLKYIIEILSIVDKETFCM